MGLHRRLSHAENTQGPAGDDPVGPVLKKGNGPLPKHRRALTGGAGEHDHPHSVHLKAAARGGAPVVLEGDAALGKIGLLVVVLGHFAAVRVELFKISLHAQGGLPVEDQLFPKALSQHIFGQVVAGGAKPPRGDDEVGPAAGGLHHLPEPLGVIPHHGVVKHIDAQGGQLLGEDLGVGIGDVAQQQLGAHGDQFGCMDHKKPPLKRTE